VQSETNIVTDLIALYKALGGGWESMPSSAQSASPTPTNAATETNSDRN